MKKDIQSMCAEFRDKVIGYRHYLHQNPELSFKEVKTSAWIKGKLEELGIPMLDQISGNSVVGYLEGAQPGPVVAFRADIDALPVEEQADVSFKSKVPGLMHACGHDSHTAILMGIAEFFASHRELIKGKIKFMFQQAEEMVPGGARILVEDGAVDDVDYVYGLHVMDYPTGSIGIKEGIMSAAIGEYKLVIHGKGGHTSMPQAACDPILAATEVAQAIHQIAAVNIDPMENFTIAVSFIHGGEEGVYNVIPEYAALGGTIRSMGSALRDRLFDIIEQLAKDVCQVRGCTCEMTQRVSGYPSMENDAEAAKRVIKSAKALGYKVEEAKPLLGGEDFSYYQLKAPGAMFWLGANAPDGSAKFMAHNGKMCLDENAFIIGMEIMIGTYLETVGE